MLAGTKIWYEYTVRGKTLNQSFLYDPVQIMSMGMMTEYYHFFFTTLVRKSPFSILYTQEYLKVVVGFFIEI